MSNAADVVPVTDALLDRWVTDPAGPVALHLKQTLLPVEESRVVFPPTYADIGYNVDTLADGTRVATIDSVGSQANRLEPMFLCSSEKPEEWLVPQIDIVLREEPCGECEDCRKAALDGGSKKKKPACEKPRKVTRSLLDLAHRAADAVVQSSPELLEIVAPAFRALQRGDAGPLCTIAPTSLVFGVWDSRGDTGEKRPRLVRSIIRAWDVEPLRASAQYNSVWKLLDEEQQVELEKEAKARKAKLSEKGLADAPAAGGLGGVRVNGSIEREVTVNLVALRGLRGADDAETAAMRRYLLGLSLLAATADMELFLREGCLLRYADNGDHWREVPRRGEPTPIGLGAETADAYARKAAQPFRARWPEVFGDRWPRLQFRFDVKAAKALLKKKTAEEESA